MSEIRQKEIAELKSIAKTIHETGEVDSTQIMKLYTILKNRTNRGDARPIDLFQQHEIAAQTKLSWLSRMGFRA